MRALTAAVLLAGCAHFSRSDQPAAILTDTQLGYALTLSPSQAWAINSATGRAVSAAGVEVRVGMLHRGQPSTALACRAAAHEFIAKTGAPEPTDQGLQAPWTFTLHPPNGDTVRVLWAFWPSGADCLLLEVTGPETAAQKAFGDALDSFRVLPRDPNVQREMDLEAAVKLLTTGDYAAALERFEGLIASISDVALLQYGALMSAYALGPNAFARALAHGQAALAIRGNGALSADHRRRALETVGILELSMEHAERALVPLSELVVRAPRFAEGHYNYACALSLSGHVDAALKELGQALALDPALAAHAKNDRDFAPLAGPHFDVLMHGVSAAPSDAEEDP